MSVIHPVYIIGQYFLRDPPCVQNKVFFLRHDKTLGGGACIIDGGDTSVNRVDVNVMSEQRDYMSNAQLT